MAAILRQTQIVEQDGMQVGAVAIGSDTSSCQVYVCAHSIGDFQTLVEQGAVGKISKFLDALLLNAALVRSHIPVIACNRC